MLRFLLAATFLLPFASWATPSCPEAFPAFLAQFEQRMVFRLAHTRFPLLYSFVDSLAEPEPKTVVVQITRANVDEYPGAVFPSHSAQAAVPVERNISLLEGGMVVVRFHKPDTDMYTKEFHFQAEGACWNLVRVDDGSL